MLVISVGQVVIIHRCPVQKSRCVALTLMTTITSDGDVPILKKLAMTLLDGLLLLAVGVKVVVASNVLLHAVVAVVLDELVLLKCVVNVILL